MNLKELYEIFKDETASVDLASFGNLLNQNKMRILELCKKEPLKYNILGVSKKLKIGYKSTYHHIKSLEKEGYIEIRKIITKKGKKSFIVTTKKYDS